MKKLNIFPPGSELTAGLTDASERSHSQQTEKWYLAHILANISILAASIAGTIVHKEVTFSTDTNIHASGDVLADTQPITGAFRVSGGNAKIEQIVLTDKDDQAAADIDVVFLRSNTSLGTENAAPSISDANALEIVGVVKIPSASFIDLGGAKQATVTLSVPLDVYATTGTTLYVALITRGTPTQTASGLVASLAIRQL